MGIFVPAPNCVVTTFLMELDGKPVAVMPSFRKLTGSINIFNLTTFNTAIHNAFVTNVLPLLSEDITMLLTQSQRQNVISDIAASHSADEGSAGLEGPSLPSGCAARMEVRTNLPGRPYRGAIYHPGVPTNQVVLNSIDTDWQAALSSGWDTLMAAGVTAGWQMVVRSKFLNNAVRPVAVLEDVETFAFRDNIVDYQRRRKPDPGIVDGESPSEVLFVA